MTPPPSDPLNWLMRWYAAQCDGDWEHSYGVKIETLDNPGWSLTIDLVDTDLEDRPFERVAADLDAGDGDPAVRWHGCEVENGVFRGYGGARDLGTLIDVFRAWAERG